MRALSFVLALGLGSCADLNAAQHIALSPLQGAMPKWQDASPNPRPVTGQYTQIRAMPESAETVALEHREELREQESARIEAAWRQTPQKATIKPMNLYTEAPVCTSYASVRLMLDVIQAYWGDADGYKIMGSQAALLYGPAPTKPVPEAYGCVLLPIGTRVTANMKNMFPVITTKFKGKLIIGVTVDAFLNFDNPMPD